MATTEQPGTDPDGDGYFETNAERYRSVVRVLFMDLLRISEHEPELLDHLYYNREGDLIKFQEALRHLRRTRGNILVTGGAGVGKSTFVFRVLSQRQFIEQFNMVPIIADFRKTFDRHALQLDFLADFSKYLDSIGYPLASLADGNTIARLDDNKTNLLRHLRTVPKSDTLPYPLIFLDDFDYLEKDDLFPVLEWLMGFAVSDRCSVVLTARPALYNAANRHDDRVGAFLIRNVQQIKLKPITPNKMIACRMAALLREDAEHPLSRLSHLWTKHERPFRRFLERMQIDSFDDLKQVSLPFDAAFCAFMASVTNGNIREILAIAETALAYIMKNYRRLGTSAEDHQGEPVQRKHIPEDTIIGLFPPEGHDEKGEDPPSFRLLNLHEHRSSSGSSLFYNVLEAIRDRRSLSPQFFGMLAELGHDRNAVDGALRLLEGKAHPLIETTGIVSEAAGEQLYPQYRLTEKGEYYLSQIAHWPDYVRRFGEPGYCVRDILAS